ncbi:hypothetical protein C8Q73DRAFT_684044 [Cubamyces lactineus]|nr:hypothetical protein C8Q73DRAFT_684044 [Cubamyces lactineus]
MLVSLAKMIVALVHRCTAHSVSHIRRRLSALSQMSGVDTISGCPSLEASAFDTISWVRTSQLNTFAILDPYQPIIHPTLDTHEVTGGYTHSLA